MQTIWKFPLETTDVQTISVPCFGTTFLCVQVQNGNPCLWALVDLIYAKVNKTVRIFGTGHPVHGVDPSEYIGTYQLESGALVFHVFVKATTEDI